MGLEWMDEDNLLNDVRLTVRHVSVICCYEALLQVCCVLSCRTRRDVETIRWWLRRFLRATTGHGSTQPSYPSHAHCICDGRAHPSPSLSVLLSNPTGVTNSGRRTPGGTCNTASKATISRGRAGRSRPSVGRSVGSPSRKEPTTSAVTLTADCLLWWWKTGGRLQRQGRLLEATRTVTTVGMSLPRWKLLGTESLAHRYVMMFRAYVGLLVSRWALFISGCFSTLSKLLIPNQARYVVHTLSSWTWLTKYVSAVAVSESIKRKTKIVFLVRLTAAQRPYMWKLDLCQFGEF